MKAEANVNVHDFEVVSVQQEFKEENGRTMQFWVITLKMCWVSPASSLINKLYHIALPNDYISDDVLLGNWSSDTPVIIPGFIKNGQLTLLDRVDEVKPVDWSKFEPIGSFNLYKPKNHNS